MSPQDVGAWLSKGSAYVLAGGFLALALMEVFRPRRPHGLSLRIRWTTNLGLQAINTVAWSLLLPLAAMGLMAEGWTAGWRPATAAVASIGPWPVLLFGIVALDLSAYLMHRLEHVVRPLWRLHAVHHSDTDLDVSTGFRHHPIEYLVSFATGISVVALLGLPPWVVSVYAVLATVAALAQHANLSLPLWVDQWLRRVLVTPSMHEVHHPSDARDHDTNYGMVFSIWDRLLGTYRSAPALGAGGVQFGVEPFLGRTYASLLWGLLLPLKVRRLDRPAPGIDLLSGGDTCTKAVG